MRSVFHKMNISLSSNSKKVDAELLFQMVTNLPIELTKSVPNGYSRTTIGEIMKILYKLRNDHEKNGCSVILPPLV